MKGAVLIVSGPSGSGKSSLLKYVFEHIEDIFFSVSCTTRSMRDGEVDGVHYKFLTKDQFMQKLLDGEFLEWANVHGNLYGTLKKPVHDALSDGKLVVFDVDVQGQKALRIEFEECVTSVFITTPSKGELANRLKKRGSDTKESIDVRLKNALEEMFYLHKYDYLLINDNIERASEYIVSIAKAARLKSSIINSEAFISVWNKL